MTSSTDPVDRLATTLLLLRDRLGSALYRRALVAARVAVARAVLAEAERRAGCGQSIPPFPGAAQSRIPSPAERPGARRAPYKNQE
jgi:hypothetical protein